MANERVWQWPVWAQIVLGAIALDCALMLWARRGAVVGIGAFVVVALMTAVTIAGERWMLWQRRHVRTGKLCGGALLGGLMFVTSALITNWSAARCAFQAVLMACTWLCWWGWRRYW